MNKPEPSTAERLARAKRELDEITFVNEQLLRALRAARAALADREKMAVVDEARRILGIDGAAA